MSFKAPICRFNSASCRSPFHAQKGFARYALGGSKNSFFLSSSGNRLFIVDAVDGNVGNTPTALYKIQSSVRRGITVEVEGIDAFLLTVVVGHLKLEKDGIALQT